MSYYNLVKKLETYFDNDPMVNTITEGNIFDVDLSKQTLFTLVHIIVNTCTPQNNVLNFNITVSAMDIVDISKTETTDKIRRNDNQLDVLNTTLAVLLRFEAMLKRGELLDDLYSIDGEAVIERFPTERFENNIAGWEMTFNILVPNYTSVCANQNGD
jgi:hypothetical protein